MYRIQFSFLFFLTFYLSVFVLKVNGKGVFLRIVVITSGVQIRIFVPTPYSHVVRNTTSTVFWVEFDGIYYFLYTFRIPQLKEALPT